MTIQQTGFILYTIEYEKCVAFYENVLKLDVLYRREQLTCFDFHGSYLMVELDDETTETVVTLPKRDRTCLRLNVPDVKEACKVLEEHSIPYDYYEFDWGTIAKFRDPDGNLIGFRSAQEHEAHKKDDHS